MDSHLDHIKELFTFEELLEQNDLDHDAVLEILFSLGYITYPPQQEQDTNDHEK
jgi:hypothetical protein